VIDAGVLFGCSQKSAIFGANVLTSRLRAKNIGGRIAPAAIAGLIKGGLCSVNALPVLWRRQADPESADKVLMRLNFSGRTG
jgi:hypothetical protein